MPRLSRKQKKSAETDKRITEMSEQQRKYIDMYFEHLCDKKAAAIAAGYSDKGIHMAVYRLDHNELVQAEIMKRERLIRTSKIKKLDSIAADLERNADEAYQAGKYSDSNRALELLAKLQGAFKDKVEIDANIRQEHVPPSDMLEDILSSLTLEEKREEDAEE